MQYIASTSYVDQAIKTFFQPTRIPYDSDLLSILIDNFLIDHILDNNNILKHEEFYVTNRHNQKLIVSLITNRPVIEEKYLKYQKYIKNVPENCIIYMHGFGSNRFQALNLVMNNQLMNNYGLCSFDFSASGKSQGTYVTYGNKQKSDIQAILNFLKKKGFKKFILWGRSMGATTSILFNAVQQSNQQIILQVLDSPFTTFQNAAKQIVKKKLNIPSFAFDIVMNLVKKHCQKYQYNPFDVNTIKDIQKCIVPSLFLFSKNDSILSHKNSQEIIKHCKFRFQKVQIQEDHNHPRSQQTIAKVFDIIQRYVKKSQKLQSKKRISTNNNTYYGNQIEKDFETRSSVKDGFTLSTQSFDFRNINKKKIQSKQKQKQRIQENQYGLINHNPRKYINQRIKTQEYDYNQKPTMGRIQSLGTLHTADKKDYGFKFSNNSYHNNYLNNNQMLKKKGLQRNSTKQRFYFKQTQRQSQNQILKQRQRTFSKNRLNSGNGCGLWVSMKFDDNNIINLNKKQRSISKDSKYQQIPRFVNKKSQSLVKKVLKLNSNTYSSKNLHLNIQTQMKKKISQQYESVNKVSSIIYSQKSDLTGKYLRQRENSGVLPTFSKISSQKNFYFDSQIPNNKMDIILQTSKSNQSSLMESNSYFERKRSQLKKINKKPETLSNNIYI